MVETTAKEDRFNWWLPFYAVATALVVFVPLMIWSADGDILYLLIALIVSVGLALFAIRYGGRRRLSILAMLVVYLAVSWALTKHSFDVRNACRWLLWSKAYKAKVLAQSTFSNGELKHVEWDGWGFPGAGDTVVYLVFDPNNSLAAAARSQSPGKFGGVPCEAPSIRRMEGNWYTVRFYTETDWDHCQ